MPPPTRSPILCWPVLRGRCRMSPLDGSPHSSSLYRLAGSALALLALALVAFAAPSRFAQAEAEAVPRHDLSHPVRLREAAGAGRVSLLRDAAVTWLGPVPIVPLPQPAQHALADPF